jgi:DhnA family fructose-bisphosphate aldolase class Ia
VSSLLPRPSPYALPAALWDQLTSIRIHQADTVRTHADWRPQRSELAPEGRLVILAADHPARQVTGALGDPLGLGDRREYLGRIIRILQNSPVDGLMGTPDIIEEVQIIDWLLQQQGQPPLLAERLLIGCLNRGGLAGTVFELLDTFTAYDAAGADVAKLDGVKLMFRLDPASRDSGTTVTLCAQAINECLERRLAVFVEPLMVQREGTKWVVCRDAESLIKVCGVASALGRSSLNTWLKVPCTTDFDRVARSTTCPILLLGGEARGQLATVLDELAAGLAAGANVRGALIGRNVLYPGNDDPAQAARAVVQLVREHCGN